MLPNVDAIEKILAMGEISEGMEAKVEVSRISRGNNLCILLEGEPFPSKQEMEPYTLYVYKDENGKLFVDTKENNDLPKEINIFLDTDTINRIKTRMGNLAHAEHEPLGSKQEDVRDIETIFIAAEKNNLVKRTYRQAAIDNTKYISDNISNFASTADKALFGAPSIFFKQIAIPTVVFGANLVITAAFGSKRNIPFPKDSYLGKYINSAGELINKTWKQVKDNKYIGLPFQAVDGLFSGIHGVTNSRAFSRFIGFAAILAGVGAATIATGGTILAVGAAAMTGLTISGTIAEVRRMRLESKHRHLNDLIAHSHVKQQVLSKLQQKNPKAIDLEKILNLSNSNLRTTAKPKNINYKVTETGLGAERQAISHALAQGAALAADAVSGNMIGLATKAVTTTSDSVSSAINKIKEDDIRHSIRQSINRLEEIAPDGSNKDLKANARRAIIEAKALEIAHNDAPFMEALGIGDEVKLQEHFERCKKQAEQEWGKEAQIEVRANQKAKNDKEFVEIFEKARNKPENSPEVQELKEKMEQYKKEAKREIEAEKGFFSRIAKKFKIRHDHFYGNGWGVNLQKIGTCLGTELFGERTSYGDIKTSSYLSDSAIYMRNQQIIEQQTYGAEIRQNDRELAANTAKARAHSHNNMINNHQEQYMHAPEMVMRSAANIQSLHQHTGRGG
ncbi:MAG: hypothetical protein AABY27_01140 [Pseudomonadota bacterium]